MTTRKVPSSSYSQGDMSNVMTLPDDLLRMIVKHMMIDEDGGDKCTDRGLYALRGTCRRMRDMCSDYMQTTPELNIMSYTELLPSENTSKGFRIERQEVDLNSVARRDFIKNDNVMILHEDTPITKPHLNLGILLLKSIRMLELVDVIMFINDDRDIGHRVRGVHTVNDIIECMFASIFSSFSIHCKVVFFTHCTIHFNTHNAIRTEHLMLYEVTTLPIEASFHKIRALTFINPDTDCITLSTGGMNVLETISIWTSGPKVQKIELRGVLSEGVTLIYDSEFTEIKFTFADSDVTVLDDYFEDSAAAAFCETKRDDSIGLRSAFLRSSFPSTNPAVQDEVFSLTPMLYSPEDSARAQHARQMRAYQQLLLNLKSVCDASYDESTCTFSLKLRGKNCPLYSAFMPPIMKYKARMIRKESIEQCLFFKHGETMLIPNAMTMRAIFRNEPLIVPQNQYVCDEGSMLRNMKNTLQCFRELYFCWSTPTKELMSEISSAGLLTLLYMGGFVEGKSRNVQIQYGTYGMGEDVENFILFVPYTSD